MKAEEQAREEIARAATNLDDFEYAPFYNEVWLGHVHQRVGKELSDVPTALSDALAA
jgi:hypothetical protein